ncbi:MAG: peptidoglycan-binding protein [Rhizobiaceae bacterium]
MGRSARLPDFDEERESPVRQAFAAIGSAIGRNPAMTAGATAFLVALSFVAANALWYQPHFHGGAFFVTRIVPEREVLAEAAQEQAEVASAPTRALPPPDALVMDAQQRLAEMTIYTGEIDGRSGPATRRAIEMFQAANGITVTGMLDARTQARLNLDDRTAAIEPAAEETDPVARMAAADPVAQAQEADARVRRIQAGLRAFGNEGIEIDGKVGAQTRAAIREFQTLFGLPVNGEPDEALFAKMREVGLMQ